MNLVIYKTSCPNCKRAIGDERLKAGFPCSKCLVLRGEKKIEICSQLKKRRKLRGMRKYCEVQKKFEEYKKFFERCIGSFPENLQENWIKRVLFGESFAIVAPPGVGKTTFGIVTSLFLKGKSFFVVPTRLLATQTGERLEALSKKARVKRKIFVYSSSKGDKERLKRGDFDILVGTNMFLHKNFDLLLKFKFSFIFIDDVDSFLKRAKNVDYLFKLLGFFDWEIKLALKEKKTEKDFEILEKIRKRKRKTILVLSSATLKPKTKRVNLFSSLLGFSIQKATVAIRNVVDVKRKFKDLREIYEFLPSFIKFFGKGGIIYVSQELGKKEVEKLKEKLKKEKINVVSYLDFESPKELIEKLEKGKFDVALGLSHISNPLVRGIDLPKILRYAIFIDVPKKLFSIKLSLNPSSLYYLTLILFPLFEEKERLKIVPLISFLKKYLFLKEEDLEKYPQVKEKVKMLRDFLQSHFEREKFLSKIRKREDISLKEIEGELFVVVGDPAVYIQATGRVSRLVGTTLTKGASFIFYTDEKALRSLEKRLKTFFFKEEIDFWNLGKKFSIENRKGERILLEEIKKEIDKDREKIKKVLTKEKTEPEVFKTTLLIVESPRKAETITSFFGTPQRRILENLIVYEIPLEKRLLLVCASLGHIFDLTIADGFFGVLKRKDKFIPVYDTIKICQDLKYQHSDLSYILKRCGKNFTDKRDLIESLQKLSFEVDEIFIATDPDTEGEKIAFDLFTHLSFFNKNIHRAEFHEITKRAFLEAIEKPRQIDLNLVKAQLIRRILDRWLGFVLSRKLWKVFGRKTLSAGRVQTPVLGWVIERFKESQEKKIRVSFLLNNFEFSFDFEEKEKGEKFFEGLDKLKIEKIEEKVIEKYPPPPYTTDTILQDVSHIFGISAPKTMQILQELFEAGFITYHRTDSTRVSEVGRYLAKNYIEEKFGKEFSFPRSFEEKKGAHECIRPTRSLEKESLQEMIQAGLVRFEADPDLALKVYDLIFKRFIASQFKPAKVKEAVLKFSSSGIEISTKVIEKVLERGFDLILPFFKVFSFKPPFKIENRKIQFIPKVSLFTQGSLIQKMKERKLGRPSTYAIIIETLLKRKYIKEKRHKLFPTSLGEKVFNYLKENFPQYISEEVTRSLEEEMDRVEEGKVDFQETLRRFYEIKEILKK